VSRYKITVEDTQRKSLEIPAHTMREGSCLIFMHHTVIISLGGTAIFLHNLI